MSETEATTGVGDTLTVAGLPWVQTDRASNGHPIWQLDLPGTRWVVKDYGPGTGPFTGWRLVSGGPTREGPWLTALEAMTSAAPALLPRLLADAARLRQESFDRLDAAQRIVQAAEAASHA